jgi:DNA-binding response OmpR family regulator
MPIIIISVDNNEYELKALGANEFVNKPFNIEDLSSKISFCFNHKI